MVTPSNHDRNPTNSIPQASHRVAERDYSIMKARIWLMLVLGATSLAVYASTASAWFVSDDFYLISRVAREGFFGTWGGNPTGGFLRPVTVLSYMMDYRVWGLSPLGFHATNIILHGLNAVLVFLLLESFMKLLQMPDSTMPAFMAGALFAVLPCHSESVAWISGRTDVIATVFGLAATLCFIRSIQDGARYWLAVFPVCLAAALFAKEAALALPGVWIIMLAAYLWLARVSLQRRHVGIVFLSLGVLAVYLFSRRLALGVFIGGYGGAAHHLSLFSASVLVNVIRYVVRLLLPPLPSIFQGSPLVMLLGLGGLFAVAAGVLSWVRRGRAGIFTRQTGLLVCFISCLGVSLVPVLTERVSLLNTECERFLYLPSVFACCAGSLLLSLILSKRACAIVFLALAVGYALALQQVNTRWSLAGRLSQAMAREASRLPAGTVILNVPDNFQGAYVFRNGLTDAAGGFSGLGHPADLSVVCAHDVHALSDRFAAEPLPGGFRLRGVTVRGLYAGPFNAVRTDDGLIVTNMAGGSSLSAPVMVYVGGLQAPLFRAAGGIP